MLQANKNSKLLMFERELEGHAVTVYINNDDVTFSLPKETKEVYLSEGLSDGLLEARGFAIISSRKT